MDTSIRSAHHDCDDPNRLDRLDRRTRPMGRNLLAVLLALLLAVLLALLSTPAFAQRHRDTAPPRPDAPRTVRRVPPTTAATGPVSNTTPDAVSNPGSGSGAGAGAGAGADSDSAHHSGSDAERSHAGAVADHDSETTHGRGRAPTRPSDTHDGGRDHRGERIPPIDDVLAAALRTARSDPRRTRRALRRGRLSGLLPQLRLRARRGREIDQSLTGSGTNFSTDDDTVLEATLVFDLPRLAYGPDEVAWAREQRAQHNARWQIARLVVRLYFERRRLVMEEQTLGADGEATLRIAEIDALLQMLTGGVYRVTRLPSD